MSSYDVTSKLGVDISDYRDGFKEAESIARTSASKMSSAVGGFASSTSGDGDKIKSNYTRGFKAAETAADKFKSTLASVRDRVVSFAVYDIGKRLVAGFVDATNKGIDYNAMMETSNTKWVNMLGSQEKAAETQKVINDLASKTPYDYEGLDKFALKLTQAGLGGKDLQQNMINVGDAVAAVGGSTEALNGVSTALSQMLMKGKVSAEEMQQLAERGIPAWDLLATSMGKSKEEVIKLASEGKIMSAEVMPALIDQMGKAYGGSMATQAETFNGKLSTLKDTIAITQGELSKPMFELLKKPMQWLIDNVPLIPSKIEELKTKFTDFTSKVKLADIIQGVKDFATNLTLWATNTGIPAVQGAIDKLKPIFDDVKKVATEIYDVFKDNWPTIQTTAETVGAAVKATFDGVVEVIKPVVDYVSKFREEGNLTVPVIAGVVAAMATFKTAMAITETIGAAKIAIEALKASTLLQTFAQGGLNAVMAANPIGLLVIAIGALVAIGVLLWRNWDTIKAKAGELWTYLTTAFTNIKDSVVAKVTEIWTNITTAFTNIKISIATKLVEIWLTVTTAFTNIKETVVAKVTEIATSIATFFTVTLPEKFNSFVSFVAELPAKIGAFLIQLFLVDIPYWAGYAVGSVVKFFSELPEKLSTWLTNVVTNITEWATNLKDKATELGSTFIENVVRFFTELPGKIKAKTEEIAANISAWATEMWAKATEMGTTFVENAMRFFTELPGKVKAKTSELLEDIGSWATDMGTKATETGKTFLDNVIKFFTELPGKAKEKLDEVIRNVTSWATDMGTKATNAGKDMLEKFMTGIKDLPSKVYNLGKDIVDGLINGVKNWASGVASSASSIASNFLSGFKSALGISSPSKVMGEQAKWSVLGFINRIRDEGRNVKKSALQMANNFNNAFSPDLAYSYAGLVDDIVATNSFEATSIIKNDTSGQKKPANINIRIGKTKIQEFVKDLENTSDQMNSAAERYDV